MLAVVGNPAKGPLFRAMTKERGFGKGRLSRINAFRMVKRRAAAGLGATPNSHLRERPDFARYLALPHALGCPPTPSSVRCFGQFWPPQWQFLARARKSPVQSSSLNPRRERSLGEFLFYADAMKCIRSVGCLSWDNNLIGGPLSSSRATRQPTLPCPHYNHLNSPS